MKPCVFFPQRLQVVLDVGLLPWAIRRGEKVMFTAGLVKELVERGVSVESLKSLAEMLKWNYGKAKIGSKSVTKVAWTTLEDLLEFLEPSQVEFEEGEGGQA